MNIAVQNKANRFSVLSRGLNRKRGQMNRTEAAYAETLEARKAAGEIVAYWFEPFSLRLSHPDAGHPATYCPDFMVLLPSGLTYIDDVKGGMADNAAIVRIKTAAELFPLWRFRLVQKRLKRDGGGFKVTEV